MNCPKCSAELREETAGEITVDRCPACHGIWLDMLELEKLLKAKPADLLADDSRFHAVVGASGPRLGCPNCRGAQLIKLNSRVRPGTIIDSCQVCFGTWLDAGELARLSGMAPQACVRAIFVG